MIDLDFPQMNEKKLSRLVPFCFVLRTTNNMTLMPKVAQQLLEYFEICIKVFYENIRSSKYFQQKYHKKSIIEPL